jgi:hypothetical protein
VWFIMVTCRDSKINFWVQILLNNFHAKENWETQTKCLWMITFWSDDGKSDQCGNCVTVHAHTFFFFFCSTGVWTQGLPFKPFHQSFFVMGFFEIGFRKLFAQTGFKPQSSWSLSPEQLGLQAWAIGTWQCMPIFEYHLWEIIT